MNWQTAGRKGMHAMSPIHGPVTPTLSPDNACWRLLVVDDEPAVHAVTQLVLRELVFKGRPLAIESAYSAAQARVILGQGQEFAVILLDVVMEDDHAGLALVRHIRETLGCGRTRIILRTGQAGVAPETSVMVAYDVNDYKAKTDLTADGLATVVISALRTYHDIVVLERQRSGLERIVLAGADLCRQQSIEELAKLSLAHMGGLLGGPADGIFCLKRGDEAGRQPDVLAASGAFGQGRPVAPEMLARVDQALRQGRGVHRGDGLAVLVGQAAGQSVAVAVAAQHLSPADDGVLAILAAQLGVAADNILLQERLNASQQATVLALAHLGELRDAETGEHVLRVRRMCEATVRRLAGQGACRPGIDEAMIERMGLASILHDVGKVAIPDEILLKPGKLDAGEWEVMMTHAAVGRRILANAAAIVGYPSYLSLAAEIAGSHHERFDGSGYPHGLCGEGIPLAGRIVAVVDTFDALVSARPYKAPWPLEQAVDYLRANAGRLFDPEIVEAFLVAALEPAGAGPDLG